MARDILNSYTSGGGLPGGDSGSATALLQMLHGFMAPEGARQLLRSFLGTTTGQPGLYSRWRDLLDRAPPAKVIADKVLSQGCMVSHEKASFPSLLKASGHGLPLAHV